jgi:hypothetical protein
MTDLEELRFRLYRLERRNRTFQIAIGVLGIFAGLLVVVGMAPVKQTVLAVEQLMLTDTSGRIRGLFTAGGDEPALVMVDSNGVKRLRFRIEDSGPTLSLYDSNRALRMQFSVADDGGEVSLFNERQQPRLRLRGSNSEPQIVVHDTEGNPRAKLFVLDSDGELGSGLSFSDADGKSRILVTALPSGESVIRAGDKILAPSIPAKTAGQQPKSTTSTNR